MNPSFAALSPPGAGSQQCQACGFPERALGVGVGLVTGMRSLLTSEWGTMPRFGNFHSEPLVDFVCVCVCKNNKPVGWDFVLGLGIADVGRPLGHESSWAGPSHIPEWLCIEKELEPGARTWR